MSALRREAEVYHIGWFEAETFSRPGVQPVLHQRDLVSRDVGERRLLRKVLPNQAVDVLVCSALPTVVRLGEVTRAAELRGDLFMARKLLAVVERDRLDGLVP